MLIRQIVTLAGLVVLALVTGCANPVPFPADEK
jgi:hypothetical protein